MIEQMTLPEINVMLEKDKRDIDNLLEKVRQSTLELQALQNRRKKSYFPKKVIRRMILEEVIYE